MASLVDSFLARIGLVNTDPATQADPADYIGGDPAAATVATGHDYAETVAERVAIDSAIAAKGGKPLSLDELSTIQKAHPSADTSIATSTQDIARAKDAVKRFGAGLLSFGKWTLLALGLLLALVLYFEFGGRRR